MANCRVSTIELPIPHSWMAGVASWSFKASNQMALHCFRNIVPRNHKKRALRINCAMFCEVYWIRMKKAEKKTTYLNQQIPCRGKRKLIGANFCLIIELVSHIRHSIDAGFWSTNVPWQLSRIITVVSLLQIVILSKPANPCGERLEYKKYYLSTDSKKTLGG